MIILQKKYIVLALVFAGLLIAAGVFGFKWYKKRPRTITSPLPQFEMSSKPGQELPKNISNSVPGILENIAVQNFEAKDKETGLTQSTRSFAVEKPLFDAVNEYEAYMKKEGWELNARYVQDGVGVLSGIKNDQVMTVNFNLDTVTQKTLVTVNIVEK